MASTSCNQVARELLDHCLAGTLWPARLLDQILEADCSNAFFRIVVERLADLFEPRLCETYAELFTQLMARVTPGTNASELMARYQRVRRTPVCEADPEEIFVLSRVTLGADIKVTSMVLDAAKKRFPNARVTLVGGAKSAELFAADSGFGHLHAEYPRSASLPRKLAAGAELAKLLNGAHAIVIDPDSRLTQLGLLPVCDEERYFFFESRSYGGNGVEDLTALTRRWIWNTFGVEAEARIAPNPVAVDVKRPFATVSLGVGENSSKRLDAEFEAKLLRHLGTLVDQIWIDKGAGGEEADRVEAAVRASGLGTRARIWAGSFAGFSTLISRSSLYAGYDSAGQHAAAAFGIPLVIIFKGYVSERMFERWRPSGTGPISIVKVIEDTSFETVSENTSDALSRIVQLD